ncbi:MAG: hypothetical protein QM529_02265 [Hydrotalea sp.]|nr:hypothetical protein [Hydrotalea sp.]
MTNCLRRYLLRGGLLLGLLLATPVLALGQTSSQVASPAPPATPAVTRTVVQKRFVFPPSAMFGASRQLLPGNNVVARVGGDINTEYSAVLGAGGGNYLSFPLSPSGRGNLLRLVVDGEKNDFNPVARTISYEIIYGGQLVFFSFPNFELQRAYIYLGAGAWTATGHLPFGIISLGKDFGVLTRYAIDGSSILPPGAIKNWQWFSGKSTAGGVLNNDIVEGYGRSSADNFDTSAKVAYQTPSVYGLSAAVSYAPQAVFWSQNNWAGNNPKTHQNEVDVALSYHLNAKTINHQFLFDITGGYEYAEVLPEYSNQNNQFFNTLNGALRTKFINDVTNDAISRVPGITQAQAQQTALAAYQNYITYGDPTSAGTSLGYANITRGAGSFGLSNQEAYQIGFKFGYNPLNITRSLENIFSGVNYDLRYGNADSGENQFRDNGDKNTNKMGDFFNISAGMGWNKLYGNLFSVGLSLRPLAFLSIYGGYGYGVCNTQSCMAARFLTQAASSNIWTGGVTFALSSNFFIYSQAMGISGDVEFPRYDAAGYLHNQTNGYFNRATITVGTMASF